MLSHNFKVGALVITAIIFLSFVVKYITLLNHKESAAKKDAEKIQEILSINFNQTEKILASLGKKIIETTPNLEPKAILKIFTETPNINGYNNIFSWSLFDFVNIDGFQVVTTMLGVRKNPPKIALERNYLNHGNEPWKIIFSSSVIGIPSEIYVIPAGVQIETKDRKRVGAVTVGIDVKKLVSIIEPILSENVSFLVIDQRNDQLTLGSSEENFGKVFNRMPQSLDGKNYVYEKRMDSKYPYKIWVGYDKKEFWREVFYSSLTLITQIVGISACFGFLLHRLEK